VGDLGAGQAAAESDEAGCRSLASPAVASSVPNCRGSAVVYHSHLCLLPCWSVAAAVFCLHHFHCHYHPWRLLARSDGLNQPRNDEWMMNDFFWFNI
jgi:hypothetical protein